MFDRDFIDAKNMLFGEEGYSKIALVNLDNTPDEKTDLDSCVIFLDRYNRYEYLSILKGDGSPLNWLFLMDRYVCASDKGSWCIYCEKKNDIAVLAVRHKLSYFTILMVRNLLKADSIRTIFEPKIHHLFDFDKLVPSWKTGLVAGYGVRGT